jgi:hypothetical protein
MAGGLDGWRLGLRAGAGALAAGGSVAALAVLATAGFLVSVFGAGAAVAFVAALLALDFGLAAGAVLAAAGFAAGFGLGAALALGFGAVLTGAAVLATGAA